MAQCPLELQQLERKIQRKLLLGVILNTVKQGTDRLKVIVIVYSLKYHTIAITFNVIHPLILNYSANCVSNKFTAVFRS